MKMKAAKFHKEIFDESAIKKTIVAFSKLTEVSMIEHGYYYICYFNNCLYEEAQTLLEFENYIIDLMNCKE